MLKSLLVAVGVIKETDLRKRYPKHKFGDGTYGNLIIRDYMGKDQVSVGSYTSIGPGVTILLGADHRVDWVTTFPFNILVDEFSHITGHPKSGGDVVIGSDVWLGLDSVIMSGVTIGDGAVVAARSLVTKDVPPFAIVGGVPAKLIRYRFDLDTRSRLLKIGWWNWSHSEVMKYVPLLQSDDVNEFIERVDGNE